MCQGVCFVLVEVLSISYHEPLNWSAAVGSGVDPGRGLLARTSGPERESGFAVLVQTRAALVEVARRSPLPRWKSTMVCVWLGAGLASLQLTCSHVVCMPGAIPVCMRDMHVPGAGWGGGREEGGERGREVLRDFNWCD